MRALRALVVIGMALGGGLHAEVPSLLEPGAENVDLDEGEAPPVIKANTLFRVTDGEREWEGAYRHATRPLSELGGLPARSGDIMMEGFRSVRQFRSEIYSRREDACELGMLLSADEARVAEGLVKLTGLRLVFFMSSETISSAPKAKSAVRAPPKIPGALNRSRFVVLAPEGLFDPATSEGRASAPDPEKEKVRIEIYGQAPDGTPTERMGELCCEGVRWRAWTEPATGTSEMVLYAVSRKSEERDPLVNGRFVSKGPSGEESVMEIQGRGMVFQASLLDHLRPVLDEQGRQVGVTNILRRRVLFHREIGLKSEGSNAAPLIPFQDAPQPVAKEGGKHAKPAPKLGGPPEARSRTVVVCQTGPCIIDLAVRPRTLTPDEPERVVPLAQRFEFLNGVILRKVPLDPPPGAKPSPVEGPRANLRCMHLCFQYPPQAMASLPEYAEALGGVHMEGTHSAAEGVAPTPFRVDCQRVYFDGASDASILEGLPGTPIEIADEAGELSTQTCVVTRKTQTLYMPGEGPKRALVHSIRKETPAGAEPKPATGGLDLGGGDLAAHWMGPFRREMVRILATPGRPESVKEVLTLTKNVDIVQQAKGLRIQGQFIRIVRDAGKGQIERLEGHGQVLVRSGDMQVKGESVAVNLRYGPDNEIVQNTVIVWGQRENNSHAVLWQGQSAVRSERFVIDALNNNFQAYGGVVARVNLPAPPDAAPKPEAAGGAALMPGFSLTGGGKLGLQCEGDFEFDGGSGLLRATQNVLLHQEGMQIVSDSLVLALQQPPKADDPKAPALPKGRDAEKDKAKPEEAKSGLFSGNVQSVECGGRVELVTPTQVVHCDRLFYNMIEDRAFLDMARPEDAVRVYLKEPSGGTKILEVAQRLDYNGKTGVFEPRSRMLLKPYKDKVPLPRGAPPLARPVPVPPAGGKTP